MHALPQLAHIPDATRTECIRLALSTTGSDTAWIEHTLLAKSINELRGGDAKAKKDVEAIILQVLYDDNRHAKFEPQQATIRPKRRGAGHVVKGGKLFWTRMVFILFCFLGSQAILSCSTTLNVITSSHQSFTASTKAQQRSFWIETKNKHC
jgi:hypothetical protein